MMVKEAELVESFRDLNLCFTLTSSSIRLIHVVVTSDFYGQIALVQSTELEFHEILTLVKNGKLKDFAKGIDELWRYQG